MSDCSFLLSLRGAIILGPCVLAVEVHFTPLLKNLQWTPTPTGSCSLVPAILIKLFYTSIDHAAWISMSLFSTFYTSLPVPSMTAQTISSASNALHSLF